MAEVQAKPVFSPKVLNHLAANNPLGMRLTGEDVQDWFDMIWCKYETYRYKDHRRAVGSWWSRISSLDITRARERAARMREQDEVAVMEALAEDIHETDPKPRTDYFARMRNG